MTVACQITIGRMCLIPVFVALAYAYGHSLENGQADESLRWWALGVFVLAASLDGVDGWVARRFNQCSDLGAYLDPIADKALMLSGVLMLSLLDWGAHGWRLPWWFAVMVVLRDCIILGGIKILYEHHRKVKIIPHWTGKVCTVTQMFALGWVMLRVVAISPVYPCAVAGFFTIWSCFSYIQQGRLILRGYGQD
jgi:CDP-diacylglycerol--glycerol-3-phosphate 3-phosphatidyltransferase